MRWECRQRFSHRWLKRKPLVSNPGMHPSTCVTHVLGCLSGSLICIDGENIPGIPGACGSRDFTYLARGPLTRPDFCATVSSSQQAKLFCNTGMNLIRGVISEGGVTHHEVFTKFQEHHGLNSEILLFTLGVGFSISICRLTSMRVMLSHSHLLFIMEIPISGNTVFILNLGPVIPVCNGGNYRSNDGMQIWGLYGRRNGLRHIRNWHRFATYWTTYQYVDLNVFHIVQGNLLLANGS